MQQLQELESLGGKDEQLEHDFVLLDEAELARQRELEYCALLQDISIVQSMYHDMEELIDKQQDALDETEEHLIQTQLDAIEAEHQILDAAAIQTKYSRMLTAVYVIGGTVVGIGFGSLGMLAFGIKPLVPIIIGGGIGLAVATLG